ncbi:erythromycin esterase family protein [Streptomyces lancefieldiae]|uniref:Erythromycin esterase family protein n=1 Tax=Streptomyces lancefieldiae TaxID=3075520 RepID=A0ABU3B0H1_9ACTN|nr:erythromycin esterase family protein [Streptomyces sp. DSM 40712]MDT0615940.1 erythromycin esterase family protein [Streptomyces sp. DSM 40712]
MSHAHPVSRRRLLSLATATVLASGSLGTGTAAARTSSAAGPVDALNRGARPLSDLNALGRMIGDAHVVGLGEASHSAHEFFTLKQRIFRHLVATKGFTTFALEASWSTGLRLDAYVTRGSGDPAQIMRDEFQGQYVFWNTQEYLDLIRWMRRYNITHPDRPQLRFVGNDLGYAGPDAFHHVTGYLAAHRPELAERIGNLYAGLEPAAGAQAGPWMTGQLAKELPARRSEADRAAAALALLRDHGLPGTAARGVERAHAWAVQNATAIAQSFTAYALPDEQFPERMRYRDRAMAANTAWWLRHEGGRILLASNNGHIAYTSDNPDEFPEPTGAFLRARLGPDYVNIGLTFNQGTVNALPDFTAQQPQAYTVTPAPKGHNEYTLDKLRHRDFSIDLRTAPPAARTWLAAARPTRSYGLYWSPDDPATALGRSYDILIHLRQVEAAHILR